MCTSTICPSPSCCINEKCMNSTSCSLIPCGTSFCQIDECCKKNFCLSQTQCFIEKNLNYFYYVLGFVFLLFLLAVYRLNKKQKALKPKKKRIPIKKKLEIIQKEDPKLNPLEEVIKEAVVTDMNAALQPEIKLTEREELLNSDSYISHSKEFGFLSDKRKDLTKYVIKNHGSALHVNLRALSQTANKLIRVTTGFSPGEKKLGGRFKSIHVDQPFTSALDLSLTHKKYFSLKDGPTNTSGNKTP